MFKYYNHRLVKQYRSYSVEKICGLFKDKKLHPQTVREWVKSGQLATITTKPITVYGEVLIDFLEQRNQAHKQHLGFNQFKCVSCKEIDLPKDNAVALYQNKNGSYKAVAYCATCNNQMTRFYKKTDHAKLNDTFTIKQAELLTLSNQLPSTSKTHLDSTLNNGLCESQKQLSKKPPSHASKTNLTPVQPSLFDLL